MKPSCNNCIHQKVCSIYEFAVKYNETSIVKFKSYSMYTVCNSYFKANT